MRQLKQLERKKVIIGENTFYIRPFPAFQSAKLGAEVAAAVLPLFSSASSLIGKGKSFKDIDIDEAAPAIGAALSSLSGDKVERLLKQLLIDSQNISVEMEDGNAETLTEDIANEVFCQDVQDMLVLAFEVSKLNFSGFFAKLGVRFGSQGRLPATSS